MRAAYLWMALPLACGMASAQQACPWLTQGTAASLMGGAVNANTQVTNGEGSCEFEREDGSLRLRVVVSHQRPTECAKGEPLTGLGEDSMFCVEDVAGEHRERIRGRVRSNYFLLSMTTHAAKTSLRSLLEQVGEEVAGNLF